MGYEEAKRAIEQAEQLRIAAIHELIEQREGINAKLKELGYTEPKFQHPDAGRKKASGIASVCQVCGFGTTPPHDQRFKLHREQPEKKPLTEAELKKAGLARK